MKVKELIKELQSLDPELECVMAIDPEGNGYNQVRGADADGILPAGESVNRFDSMYFEEHGADGNCMDEKEFQDLLKNGTRLVTIYC